MSGLGSALAQHAVEGKEWNEHEAYRTRRLMLYGGIIFAPIANRWHAALNLIQLRGRWTSEFLLQQHLWWAIRGRMMKNMISCYRYLLRLTTLRNNTFIYVP